MVNHTEGRKVFAALFAVILFTLPLVTITVNLSVAPGKFYGWFQVSFVILMALVVVGGVRLSKRGWLLASAIAWGLGSASFGYAMEGWTGPILGLFAGAIGGAFAGWYVPWLLRILPERWGLRTGWAIVALAVFLLPLIAALTLLFGRVDDDDAAFLILASFLAIKHASNHGWFDRVQFNRETVYAQLVQVGRKWLDPRIAPFLFAFLFSGLIAGPIGARYEVVSSDSLTITLKAVSWLWSASLCAAAIVGISASLKKRSAANGLYLIASSLVLVNFLLVLVIYGRFKTEITPSALHLRLGLFKDISISREELLSIHRETARGRRYIFPYPVLNTRDGKSHHLRNATHGSEITHYLAEKWGVAVLP